MSNASVPDLELSSTSLLAVARPTCKERAIQAEGVSYWYGEGEREPRSSSRIRSRSVAARW